MTTFTFGNVVEYVDNVARRMDSAVTRLSDQLDRHEDYHRDQMGAELAAIRTNRIAWWSTIAALITAVLSLVTVVIVVTGHG